MRPIKFRAWDKVNKEMFNVRTLEWDFILNLATPIEHIMQFTGLKDKHGKEIYESDIIKHLKYGGVYEVYYQIDSTGFCLASADKVKNMFLSKMCVPNLEVIGNVWENPEFLQDKGDY